MEIESSAGSSLRLRLSKVAAPVRPDWTISRTHLEFDSSAFPAAKLVLLRAPAGFGKTTLLLQWYSRLQESGAAVAWLDVDEADNDPVRFMCYLILALGKVSPALASEPILAELQSRPTANPEPLVTELIDFLASQNKPFVLFIDDFECITNERVLSAVRQLAAQLPMNQQLVIASRSVPEIGFVRLRVRGQAIEFGVEALRFSEEETGAFVRDKHGLALSDAEIRMLHRGTEGWAAALHLAALSIDGRSGKGPALGNTNLCSADMTQYLAEDVLSRQPAEVNEFLLKTSILSELSAPLCDAVLGRSDSAAFLERLEKLNLFLTPLDSERSWYRYHALFADFLKSRLGAQMAAELHRKAAVWHAGQHWWISAIHHALKAGDLAFAAGLMEKAADETLHAGRMDTVIKWVEALPADALSEHPLLEIEYIWALVFRYRYLDARERLVGLVARGKAAGPAAEFHGDIEMIRAMMFHFADQFDECYALGTRILPGLSSEHPFGRGILTSAVAYAALTSSRYAEIQPLLDTARNIHMAAYSDAGTIYCELLAGMVELTKGHLQAALRQFDYASSLIEKADPSSSGAVIATALRSCILYEMDRIEDCEALLCDRLEQIGAASVMSDPIILAYRALAKISIIRGDWEGAFKRVDELRRVGLQQKLPRIVASAHLLTAEIALHQGNLDEAEERVGEAEALVDWRYFDEWTPFANDILFPAFVRLRLAFARKEHAKVIREIAPLVTRADALKRFNRSLALRLLWAKAIASSEDETSAARFLQESLPHALREGYRRTFLDEGEAIVRAMEKLAAETPVAEFLASIRHTNGDQQRCTPLRPAERHAAQVYDFQEEFSNREIQVLHLVDQGLTNRTIAERLFISEATVKFHLHNINLKTGARSRTQAIAIARRIGLLN